MKRLSLSLPLVLCVTLSLSLSLFLSACGSHKAPPRPMAVPVSIVPRELTSQPGDPALTLEEYKPGADRIAAAGSRSMISEGRVWQIRRGTTLVGALQVSTLKPRVDVTNAKERDNLAGLIMSGAVQRIHVSGIEVVMAKTQDKVVYLWFGSQMFQVLQLKGAGFQPEAILKGILDFEKPSGSLRITARPGG